MKKKIFRQLEAVDNETLWYGYGLVIKELKKRKLIRTRNIVGERGEHLAIEIYNKTPGEPNLQAAPKGTQNVDALSRKGDRYAIKTVTLPGRLTGVFYGLQPPESTEKNEKKFEYLIIVTINEFYEPVKIIECAWDIFIKYKRWHKTMRAWNIGITKQLENESRILFPKQ